MKPIKIKEIPILQDQQAYNGVINNQTTTLHSPNTISILNNENQLIIITLDSKEIVSQNIKADSHLFHPNNKNILVLRKKRDDSSQTIFQIFDLETRVKLYHQEWANEILYWQWTSQNEIDVVEQEKEGNYRIKRLNIETQQIITLITISGCQQKDKVIMNYETFKAQTTNKAWGVITHIKEDQIVSSLFSVEQQNVQKLQACCCCFASLSLTSNYYLRDIVLFIEKSEQLKQFKLVIVEIGIPPLDLQKIQQYVYFQLELENDVPTLMYVNKHHGLLFIISRRGYLIVYELRFLNLIYQQQLSEFPIISGKPDENNGQYSILTENGTILTISIDYENLVSYVTYHCSQIKDLQEIIKHWQ